MKKVIFGFPARLPVCCALLCFSLLALVAPSSAHAGYYESSVSGGKVVIFSYGQTTTLPYSMHSDGWGGNGEAWWLPWYGSGSAQCQEAITTTFTWHSTGAGDDPPSAVVVKETSQAGYSIAGQYDTASCDDGLEDTPVINGNSGSCSGTRYTLKQNPGSSFQLNCTPAVQISGSSSRYGYGIVSVRYSSSVWPVQIVLTGTAPANGTDNILVGQGCSASFTCSAPVTFQNYQWSVAGDKFASFYISADQTSGHVVDCDPAIWTTANPQWYWNNKGDGTVSGSVTVIWNGITLGTVQASKPVTVWVPYSKMSGVPSSVSYTSGQASVIAKAPSGTPGMTFTGSVGTPELFLNGSAGQWCFAQWLWLDRVQHAFSSPIGKAVTTDSALDGSFPYSSFYTANSQADLHTEQQDDDSPEQGFIDNVQSFLIADTFRMYIMYKPPDAGGGKPQWVPIQSLRWHWNTSGSRNPFTLFSPDPPSGSVTADGSSPETIFPRWTTKFSGHN